MATYNWSYRPGIPNKYNLQVFGGETTRGTCSLNGSPIGTLVYVSISGNDVTGNGSKVYPFRTITKAREFCLNAEATVIISSGTYREALISPNPPPVFIGDGNVKIDYEFFNSAFGNPRFYNINFFAPNYYVVSGQEVDSFITMTGIDIGSQGIGRNNIFKISGEINLRRINGGVPNINFYGYNTYLNSNNIIFQDNAGSISNIVGAYNSIFSNCSLNFSQVNAKFDYVLFHNCKFKFNAADQFTIITTKEEFLQKLLTKYPNNDGFKHAVFADPKFNNPSIDDYTLAFDSPAKNASYLGTYAGAKSIGYAIAAKADSNLSGFDNETAVNLSVNDNLIEFIDNGQNASIYTKPLTNIISREIKAIAALIENADRNGEYVDSIGDLEIVKLTPGTLLKRITPYLVTGSAITYKANIIQPGTCFTTDDTDDSTFTTEEVGLVQEILEAPQRHTILFRTTNGIGQPIAANTPLSTGNWYSVIGNSALYNEKLYNKDENFKAVEGEVHTGNDILLIFEVNTPFFHLELNAKPTTNNVDDSEIGDIIRGNGDPDYIRGAGKELPLNRKYLQMQAIFRHDNLEP